MLINIKGLHQHLIYIRVQNTNKKRNNNNQVIPQYLLNMLTFRFIQMIKMNGKLGKIPLLVL